MVTKLIEISPRWEPLPPGGTGDGAAGIRYKLAGLFPVWKRWLFSSGTGLSAAPCRCPEKKNTKSKSVATQSQTSDLYAYEIVIGV